MIDFHSHILPGIDDGSKSAEMSVEMIRALREQGVDTICATSHFYATQRTPQRFLQRRQEAFERLRPLLPDDAPRILLGAEVLYFPGISHMEELPELCLEGTDLLLLEMPFETWSGYMVREVNELARTGRFTVLLAHIERYYFQQEASVWSNLLNNGVLMQSNADFFLPFGTRRKAIRLMREGMIHLLGSDCHNTTSRAPHMAEAAARIRRHLGEDYLEDSDALGRLLLGRRPRE